ncbi:hypothetical protein HRbin16_00966 [bacterium HR16]|nr:hypothetical protein HRbin16_00966 [bacterium HR16]
MGDFHLLSSGEHHCFGKSMNPHDMFDRWIDVVWVNGIERGMKGEPTDRSDARGADCVFQDNYVYAVI